MTKNPYLNAVIAFGYIVSLVTIISLGSNIAPEEDNILMPISMISVLVLSVALMAYVFFYQPVLILLDGRHKEAAHLFLHTVYTFAGLTICALVASFVLFT